MESFCGGKLRNGHFFL